MIVAYNNDIYYYNIYRGKPQSLKVLFHDSNSTAEALIVYKDS